MPNRHRGEISAGLDGRTWTLVLTLGALAELEDAFDCPDLTSLVARLGQGGLGARDLVRILGAGLRGAGNDVTDDQVAMMRGAGGAAGFAAIVSDLLQVTFAASGVTPPNSMEETQDPFAEPKKTRDPDVAVQPNAPSPWAVS